MGKEVHWKDILVTLDMTVLAAIKKMDLESQKILLVIDCNEHLLGTITDGDIRRHLLKQGSFEETIDKIMNKNPVWAFITENQDQLLMKMQTRDIFHLPILDNNKKVVGLETLETLLTRKTRDNWVIFMAGGMGKRLHPLTLDCPKPLLKIGNKPISEILLENFIKCGFKNFIFSINYKSEMIREFYEFGENWGVNIQYIQEDEQLGTAGSLSLLSVKPDKPFFVVNADILTNINFGHVLDFHQQNPYKAQATICVRQYQEKIPFGVAYINEESHQLINIEEKPVKNHFVNAGIYILESQALQYLSFNSYCDMPGFLNHLVNSGNSVATFPIHEYWLDIGHQEHLVKAASDYLEIFA